MDVLFAQATDCAVVAITFATLGRYPNLDLSTSEHGDHGSHLL
jgi:hypothetical protein